MTVQFPVDPQHPTGGKVIEFVGVAGSGKSTLCHFIREQLLAEGVEAHDSRACFAKFREGGAVATLLARMPPASRAEARLKWRFKLLSKLAVRRFYRRFPHCRSMVNERLATLTSTVPREAKIVKPKVLRGLARFEFMMRSRSDWQLCLWEEGIAVRCVNLFASVDGPEGPEGVEEFLSRWPLTDAIVHVGVSSETATERILERRRHKRLEGADTETYHRFLRRSEVVGQAILAEARRRGVPVFLIDNDATFSAPSTELPGMADCLAGLKRIAAS